MSPATARSACREKQLLALCARTCVPAEIAAQIREILRHPLDWEYVIARAQEHCVLPLAERTLRTCGHGIVPPRVLGQLESAARANTLRCLAQTSELLRIAELFESRAIRALPYKGPLIAAQAYQDIAARQFEDLDIILRQRDIGAADAAIRSLGYQPKFPWIHSNGASIVPGEYNYFHSARQTVAELHTEATLRHFPAPPRLAEYFDRAADVDLSGKSIRTFCAEDALPIYCIHGTKDFWERLVWIADIAELLRSHHDMEWDSVWRTTSALRAERMVHLGLTLAADILDAHVPPEVLTRVRKDSAAQTLAAGVAVRLLGRDRAQRTARERFRYRRKTVQGFASGWRYAIRLTLAPAEEDWQQTQLPRRLAPLHAVLRPLRLLRKYDRTGT
jgi:hypothetical protein